MLLTVNIAEQHSNFAVILKVNSVSYALRPGGRGLMKRRLGVFLGMIQSLGWFQFRFNPRDSLSSRAVS